MRRIAMTVLVVVLACAAACVNAATSTTPSTHYRWHDAAGVVHYSDTIPSSALSAGYDIVDADGRVVRHVAPELTPAQRRAAQAAAAKQAAARRAAEQQRLQDAQMLAAYPTDKDLAASQQAQLKQIGIDIAQLQTNLRSQEESLTELLAHAADLEHQGKPVPPYVSNRIKDQQKAVSDERAALATRQADLSSSTQQFQAQLQHYRELRAQYADP